jgi:protein involved in ribonucleotide reduction
LAVLEETSNPTTSAPWLAISPSFDFGIGVEHKNISTFDQVLSFLANNQSTMRKVQGAAKAGFNYQNGIIFRFDMAIVGWRSEGHAGGS